MGCTCYTVQSITVQFMLTVWKQNQQDHSGQKTEQISLELKFYPSQELEQGMETNYLHRGHNYIPSSFCDLIKCAFCQKLMVGIFERDKLECKNCMRRVHSKCYDQDIANCSSTSLAQPEGAKPTNVNINIKHDFQAESYLRPPFCDHCGRLIWRNGFQCLVCSFKCHKKCMERVPSNCGIDQVKFMEKMLSVTSDVQS